MTQNRKEYLKEYRQEHKKEHKRVSVTLSNEQYGKLQKNAKEYQQTPTTRLKELALCALDQQANYPADVKESFITLVRSLRWIANNINQIAWHSHAFQELRDEKELLMYLQSMEKEIKHFISR